MEAVSPAEGVEVAVGAAQVEEGEVVRAALVAGAGLQNWCVRTNSDAL